MEPENQQHRLPRRVRRGRRIEFVGIACGTGCIMIHRDILEKLDFKFNQGGGFDDIIFCDEVRKLLHEKVWCNTSVQCEHLIKEKPWNWARIGNQQFIVYGAQMFKRA